MKRRYLITGAAGHLGSTILRLLAGGEDEAVGLILPGETPAVIAGNIRYVCGDVREAESLRLLFQGTDSSSAVIHTAGLISIAAKVSPSVRAVNVGGTENMLHLSREYGVGRFVYTSSVHAIPEQPKSRIIQETDAFSPKWVAGGYAKTKAEATQRVLDAARDGFPAVVVHPSGIIGPYDDGHNHLTQLTADYLRGKLPLCVKGGYDFVDVRDVARGCLLAAERGKPERCYILSGHYLSIRELLVRVGELVDRKPPGIVPMPLAKLAAPLVQAVAKLQRRRPLYTRYSLYTLTSNGNFSNERARTELGYRPRDVAETIRDMARWLLGHRNEAEPC